MNNIKNNINKNNIFKKKEEDYQKHLGIIHEMSKEIILTELESKTLKLKIHTDKIHRLDEINGNWVISIKQNQDYSEKYDRVYKNQIKLLTKYIAEEKVLLKSKIKNINTYYEKVKLENEQFQEMLSKMGDNVTFEGQNKKFITQDKLLNNLKNALNYLDGKDNNFFLINNETYFDLITYNYFHPIYGNIFDIKQFLENEEKYKYYFYKELYGKKIRKKNNKKDSFFENRYNCNNSLDSGYLFLKNNHVEVINEKQKLIKLKKKIGKKNNKNLLDENEEKELGQSIDYFKTAQKRPYFNPNKEQNNFYYIQDSKIQTLLTSLIFNLSEYYDFSDKYIEIMKGKIYLDVKYLN